MSKGQITRSVIIGFTSLALSVPASANYYYDDGYYVPTPVPLASPSPHAYAPSDSGFVFGLEGGYADTHWDNIEIFDFSSISGSGFTARVFMGYEFNQYIGIESGYIYLPNATVDGLDGQITNYAIDLLGKISVPLTSGLDLYAKAGIGYLKSSGSDMLSGFDGSHVGPAFGVGAGYEVIPNLAVNLSWMRYSGNGQLSDSDYQPNPDAVLLGMSYTLPIRNS